MTCVCFKNQNVCNFTAIELWLKNYVVTAAAAAAATAAERRNRLL